jgi:copper chaperone CopZ
VQDARSKLDGVTAAEVSTEDQRAVITHDVKVTTDKLIQVVKDSGFKATKEEDTERTN